MVLQAENMQNMSVGMEYNGENEVDDDDEAGMEYNGETVKEEGWEYN